MAEEEDHSVVASPGASPSSSPLLQVHEHEQQITTELLSPETKQINMDMDDGDLAELYNNMTEGVLKVHTLGTSEKIQRIVEITSVLWSNLGDMLEIIEDRREGFKELVESRKDENLMNNDDYILKDDKKEDNDAEKNENTTMNQDELWGKIAKMETDAADAKEQHINYCYLPDFICVDSH